MAVEYVLQLIRRDLDRPLLPPKLLLQGAAGGEHAGKRMVACVAGLAQLLAQAGSVEKAMEAVRRSALAQKEFSGGVLLNGKPKAGELIKPELIQE